MDKRIQRNKRLAILIYMLTSVSTMTATGTLMQTFLAALGLPSEKIYLHATVTQAVNIATLLLGSRWIHGQNALRRYAWASVPYGLLFLAQGTAPRFEVMPVPKAAEGDILIP